jgi:hypothetical protein
LDGPAGIVKIKTEKNGPEK